MNFKSIRIQYVWERDPIKQNIDKMIAKKKNVAENLLLNVSVAI